MAIVQSEKKKKNKAPVASSIWTLRFTFFALIAGLFGVLAFFISLMVNVDNRSDAMIGGLLLVLLSGATLYFVRAKQQKDQVKHAPVDTSNKRLADRMENLEALICRLDRELNEQIEQSLLLISKSPSSEKEATYADFPDECCLCAR